VSDHSFLDLVASLETEASMDNWEELNLLVENFACQYLKPGSKSYGLRLACEELFSNIIRHSRDESRSSPVVLDLQLFKSSGAQGGPCVLVKIEDNGPYFDPQFTVDHSIPLHQPLSERPIGGLGLFLVKQSVDRVDYEWTGSKNCYRLYIYCER
jgi:serine/threonine-protein kinase RsbW